MLLSAEEGNREMSDPKKITDFQKRAVELLVNKFIMDYRRSGEEIEHFYDVWSRQFIRELYLRDLVWKRALIKLSLESED